MALQVDISKKFSGFHMKVEFEMDGGCLGILGASGCGKSMTLKCVAGIEKPDKGRIVLNDRVLFDSRKGINVPARDRHIGYLFQNYALFPAMTVEDNLGIVIPGKKTEKGRVIDEILQRFQLSGLKKRYPSQLSGGQQQRVALARMLLSTPEVILLDEPFSALDGFLRDILQNEMLEFIRDYGKDVLMVSHSRDEIYTFCNQMVVMSEGKSLLQGNTRDIFQNPGTMEAARLTGCKNISAIERLGDYELYACDWNIRLKTAERIRETIRYIGIRGHTLIPVSQPGENTMKIRLRGVTDTPFERQVIFHNGEEKDSKQIWLIQDKKEDIPLFIQFPKEEILLLS
ncbi:MULTISPECIES: sulfate/molybdate ABC transporter ATP-binding protein [Clostridia]|uniref:ATP-binding cassette domain-containing protein n=1 Tax=Lacrimispora xylanolytica TaxID=29375 RepID=A0ABY7ACD2_9FIRM|nr:MULTISPECIES: ATP-binding cassette domain-containing protein [Clostridia]WAJ23181.1 ATP-binding cassette domain-containing protein [Lacrimispora xylanolytica]